MPTNFIASYRELPVYQMAFQGSVSIYYWAQPLLETSDADVIRSLLATSRAICAHIAAAWSQRRQREGFIDNFSTAQLAASEMQSWIEAAIVTGDLTPDAGQDLHDHYRDLYVALDQLMARALTKPQLPQNIPANSLPATA